MAQADYIRGTAQGYDDLLAIIVAWATGSSEGSPHNTRALWTVLHDYVDTDTGAGPPMNGDGERCVILRADIPGELPIYVGLRTFFGHPGKNQQGIQLNAYTHFDPDLPWDCQAGSLADPEMYDAESHFYEGCPAILVGNETICYWLNIDPKRILCTVRTPVIPQADSYSKIRDSVCYEQFYLGWVKRIVSKEGYPYPMMCAGTTYTLGNESIGYVQRNFAYNNKLGAPRHIPPFHHDYMMIEGIQSLVYTYKNDSDGNLIVGSRWPLTRTQDGECGPNNDRRLATVPLSGMGNPVCGPSNSDVSAPFSIPCISYGSNASARTKTGSRGQTIFTYDQQQYANRILYFDGLWAWYTTYPIRNSFVRSLCWCTHRVRECNSYNYLSNAGITPPLAAYSAGVQHDQIPAHYGWVPEKVVESLSGNRLLVPVYVGAVSSPIEMQSHTRSEFGIEDYDAEQRLIQIAGIMDGCALVPGLGLSPQDILKISEQDNVIQHLVVPDVYRKGAFNYATVELGATEWHEENPGLDTPRDHGGN